MDPALRTWTDSSFEDLCWHDCSVWSIGFSSPGPEDWSDDALTFDLDYILEWPCTPGGRSLFSVAPATLSFRDVTDLRVRLDWPRTDFRTVPGLPVIQELCREPVAASGALPIEPYSLWTMRMAFPVDGGISFGASGFTMTLRAAPVWTPEQQLSAAQRRRILGRG